ncbi:helix-turn-helix domain-containing protein [Hoeflea ulvae]|uniref:Helix-turn-helix transcriptional regulator n=1 Tax=Hoeflea ulvae TaxID=2983764 RepID=A0ABT3YFE2_9HYPH|nr:helix-turn-helix transcriptional regulator [Hoeflea ulvae]MCY0094514.1 helix-turn-helix transcriptional regulator [Hoeflea ulvae]
MEGSLFALPLPIFSAVLCAVIAVLARRLDLGNDKSAILFSALFSLFTLEAGLVAIRFGYGIDHFVGLQRVLPLFVGPLSYLPFLALIVPAEQFNAMLLRHLGSVAAITLGLQLLPLRAGIADMVIVGSYLFYAVALLWRWRQGPDQLIHARLGVARTVTRWMLWAAGVLIILLLLESAISLSFAMQKGGQVAAIISYGTLLMILFLVGVLFVLPRFLKSRPVASRTPSSGNAEAARLEAAAHALLMETRLFLDPDLSVQRLAKRLHVPVRNLSLAINETKGVNVSQYVNDLRLSHAANLLRSCDDSVAAVMVESGFLTRSNFYREFQRVYGQSPAAYRQSNPAP